jgi:2-iminobutanoate/2-iminopropanoate deaminase
MEIISTNNAPAAIGPYSQGIASKGLLFCSGQLGIDPSTGKLVADDTATQTEQVMKNIQALLKAGNLNLSDIVKTTIFLVSMDDFKTVNEIYGSHLGTHKPARSTVQVAKLPLGAKIEIECIAELKR